MSDATVSWPQPGTWPSSYATRRAASLRSRPLPASIMRVRRLRELRRRKRMVTAILMVGLSGAVLSGAVAYRAGGPRGESAGPDPRLERMYEAGTGKLTVVAFAADGSFRIDHWAHMDGERLLRLDIDDDRDGRVDRREYYGPGERLERTEYLEGGQVTRTETPK